MKEVDKLIKKNRTPEPKELVVVKITEFTPYGVFCDLLEYNLKGFIPITEVSRKRIKKLTEVLRIGMITVGQVLEIRENDVDLSLRKVDESEKKKVLGLYKLEKRIATIFYLVSKDILKEDEINLLANYIHERYGSFVDFLEKYRKDKEIVLNDLRKLDFKDEFYRKLEEELDKFVSKFKEKVKGFVSVYSLKPNGYKIIKEFLISLKNNLKDLGIELEYRSSPDWYIFFETNQEEKKKNIKRIINEFNNLLKKYKLDGEISFQ